MPIGGKRTLIGHMVVTTPYETIQHYECAAWYTKHQVQPGRYELWTDGYWVYVTFDTIILNVNFPTLFGGVQVGSADYGKERIGQPDRYWYQLDYYGVVSPAGWHKEDGYASMYELLPEFIEQLEVCGQYPESMAQYFNGHTNRYQIKSLPYG